MKKNILSDMLSVLIAHFGLAKILSALVASEGRNKVLSALGVKAEAKSKPKTAPKPRAKPDAVSIVAAMELDDSAKKEFLAHLAKKYDAKEFMPTITHVRGFFMRDPGMEIAKIKSRPQWTVRIFNKLAGMDLQKLRDIDYSGVYGPPKRFSVYARAIENYGRQMRAERHSRD